jgi:hypothetical protein
MMESAPTAPALAARAERPGVGKNAVVHNFETAMRRGKFNVGYVVAFS